MSKAAIKDSLRLAHRALDSYQAQINVLYAEKAGLKDSLQKLERKQDFAKQALKNAFHSASVAPEGTSYTTENMRAVLDTIAVYLFD
jgi:hypothetical protein